MNKTNNLIITIDLDWASEAAIEETLNFFENLNIKPMIFSTHNSVVVESRMAQLDIGLHPYFSDDSSHGKTIKEVTKNILEVPHNFKAFRCHRFRLCNESQQAMLNAGMLISSNVCTNMEVIKPFKNRFGLLEIPVFLEDGGYLWQKYPLEINKQLKNIFSLSGSKIIVIHPMHFVINTPNFDYMVKIKKSMSRDKWRNLSQDNLNKLRWEKRGIRDFLIDLINFVPNTITMRDLYQDVSKQHNLRQVQL